MKTTLPDPLASKPKLRKKPGRKGSRAARLSSAVRRAEGVVQRIEEIVDEVLKKHDKQF